MEIPILTKFIEGLKLFWESKRLRWLTIVFILGAVIISLLGVIGSWIVANNPGNTALIQAVTFIAAVGGGIWPIFFLLTAFLSLLGLQRFVASDESYTRSFLVFLPWMIVSFILLLALVLFAIDVLIILIFIIAFLGWIGFQSYFSTRTSLGYAKVESEGEVASWKQGLIFFSNLFCYGVIFGAFIFVTFIEGLLATDIAQWAFVFVGTLLVAGFNFINGIIMTSQRNKPTLINIGLIGLFISLYSAYFIYSAGQTGGSGLVDIVISIFFLLYTMSSVGRTLASRADLDTRFKISRELAATFTYFLASGYYFADAYFAVQAHTLGPNIDNIIKLMIFPFIALVMELRYLWIVRKGPVEEEPTPEVEALPEEVTPTEDVTEEDVEEYEEEIESTEPTMPEVEEESEIEPDAEEFPEEE